MAASKCSLFGSSTLLFACALQSLYKEMFVLLVSRINTMTAANLPQGIKTTVISVLDIYGFEIFEKNR